VIIVFAFLIRMILWPLSIPQIKSSRKMQLLQPKITELREQYKDDQKKQQMETMALYREYGINPVGGCLPLVLQLPILYALWSTLRASIELRQADFILWIHDLSTPDIIINLPFTVPVLGDELSGLALIMGATLFIQQKMMISDPRQKALVYVMPLVLTLAFNHFPSGLNLYYLVFNLLSIGQQVYLTKLSKNKTSLEDLRAEAKTKKKGRISRMFEEAQKMQEQQAKMKQTGGKTVNGRTPVEPKSKKSK
jgi:YidC/Oxa1 family membrane protein insertase